MDEIIFIQLDDEYRFRFINNKQSEFSIALSEMAFHRLKEWLVNGEPIYVVEVNENRKIILYKNKIKFTEIIKE